MYNGIQNRFELKPHNAYHFTSLVKPICFSFLNYHDKRLHFKRGFLSIGIQSLTRTLIYDPALKMLEIVWWFVPLQNINHNGVLCLCLNWGSLSSLERVPNRLGGLMSSFPPERSTSEWWTATMQAFPYSIAIFLANVPVKYMIPPVQPFTVRIHQIKYNSSLPL